MAVVEKEWSEIIFGGFSISVCGGSSQKSAFQPTLDPTWRWHSSIGSSRSSKTQTPNPSQVLLPTPWLLLFMENRPLRLFPNHKIGTEVRYNDLGWTRFANVLFIEQPAFVGFSYSNTSSDVNTDDAKAARDNKKFLEAFVSLEFKEFYGRDLWLTGESYGGVYVPSVSDLILKEKTGILYPQFKGFMIGNPVFSCQDGFIGSNGHYYIEQVNLLYWHGLASYRNYYNWTSQGCNDPKTAQLPNCQWILQNVLAQVGVQVQQKKRSNQAPPPLPPPHSWPSLDPDAIFQNFCTGNASLAFAESPNSSGHCPSLESLIVRYLNRADVQRALNVRSVAWSECSSMLNYTIAGNSMVPLYEGFFTNKPSFQILVYSGDQDILTVPFAFTQPCIAQLSGKLVSDWQPWFVHGATAGYVEVYDKYTYATVKGAGHEAPLYQPLLSFQLIYRFLTTGRLTGHPPGSSARPLRQSDFLRHHQVNP
eukprot:TRINITY_DN5208_c0_g1_i1.p1 TRINITY_DN5208_c0_g1~~TRINITY_DN5208_c0_g1_i1.p1  ORF type:complete len:478 (+),score=88.37 TRINITY_DN5208_c0_g1_i1:19-1452(+)